MAAPDTKAILAKQQEISDKLDLALKTLNDGYNQALKDLQAQHQQAVQSVLDTFKGIMGLLDAANTASVEAATSSGTTSTGTASSGTASTGTASSGTATPPPPPGR